MMAALGRWVRQPFHVLALLGMLIPVLMAAQYTARFALQVPWIDEWDTTLPLVIAFREGEVNLQTLVRSNDPSHRVFFTNLSTGLLAYATDWNVRAGAWLNLVLSLAKLGGGAGYFLAPVCPRLAAGAGAAGGAAIRAGAGPELAGRFLFPLAFPDGVFFAGAGGG
ncbi:MAG: hypothetical protein HC915_06020 [Anaerolineae bacterium]|nr:hypothetical protein [Anaerolineae bacterium]